eukprot:15121023-Ditylum_brightwellii.AAC.1
MVKADRKVEKSVEKQVVEKTEHLSIASFVLNHEKRKLMTQARKSLEGRMISYPCLLYTSDAADELDGVDL